MHYLIIAVLAFGLSLMGCEGKTGPAGPTGPAGSAGPARSSKVLQALMATGSGKVRQGRLMALRVNLALVRAPGD